MLTYVHMFLVFHGAYPPGHTVLCVGEKVRCQSPVVYHCSNALSARLQVLHSTVQDTVNCCPGQD